MATSKHIDRLCIIVIVLALVVTVLFMNGEKLGITVIPHEDDEAHFSADDLDADWDTAGATVITLTGDGADISGGGAYADSGDVYITYAGKYTLSGTLSGSVTVDADGDDTVRLLLDGVTAENPAGAALYVKQADKVILTLAKGTENALTGGSDDTADGAIYSKDDLTINGAGKLTVEGEHHGIVCNDDLRITGGDITVTAGQDGIHAHDSVRFCTAALHITAGDDGIHAGNDDRTDYIYIESGEIDIPACYEGIEAATVTVDGGKIDIAPSDDGINAPGDGNAAININGGDITVRNPDGRDADGLDSNGSIIFTGGTTFISMGSGANCSLDYGRENGGVCRIDGGTVIACGGNSMQESVSADSKQGVIQKSVTAADGTVLRLTDGDGKALVDTTVEDGFSYLILSAPGMTVGETVTLTVGETEETVTVSAAEQGGMGERMPGRGGDRQDMGEMPDMGNRPDMGERGEMPGMGEQPPGGFGGGPGDRSGGGFGGRPDGQQGTPPERPDGENFGQGDPPERPDGENFGQGDRGQEMQPPGERAAEDTEADEKTAWQGDAPLILALVAVSAFVLCIGLFIVYKKKV